MRNGLLVFLCVLFLLPESLPAKKVSDATYRRRLKESQIRQDLDSFRVSPFEIKSQEALSPELKNGVKKVVQDAMSQVSQLFGYRPREAAEVLLYRGRTYDSIDDPRIVSGGFYRDKKIRMPFAFDEHPAKVLAEFGRVFRHEYAHLVIATLDAGKSPRWFNEGLAVYVERGREGRKRGDGRAFYQRLKKAGREPNPEAFFKMSAIKKYQSGADFYEHSYVLVKYLVDRYNFRRVRELFKKMKAGSSFTTAYKEIYDLPLKELPAKAYQS